MVAVDAARLFPEYLAAVEQLAHAVDTWRVVAALLVRGSLCLCSSSPLAVHAQPETPELTQPVNDFASVIDPESARQLDSLIRALQETTGDVVVVATVDSLEGDDLNPYAERMFRNRGKGIGQDRKGQRAARACRREGPPDQDRSRLRPRAVHHGWIRRRNDPPGDRRRGSGKGRTVPDSSPACQRIIGRIGEGRNVAIQGAPRTAGAATLARQRLGWQPLPRVIVLFILINVIAGRLGRRRRRRWGGGRGAAGTAASGRLAADSAARGAAAGSVADLADSAAAVAEGSADSAAAAAVEVALADPGRFVAFGVVMVSGWWFARVRLRFWKLVVGRWELS